MPYFYCRSGKMQLRVLKSNFVENYRIKIIVITIATVFWFAVVTENVYEYDMDVPLVVVNVPPGKTVIGKLPQQARVRFEGRGKALFALLFQREARLVIDLAENGSSKVVQVQRDHVQIGRWGLPITAKQILAPHELKIQLANLLTKEVAIVPVADLTTLPGYAVVGKIQVSPDSIKISGPEALVRPIRAIATTQVQARNLRSRFVQEVPLQDFPDSLNINLSNRTATVAVDVQKLIEITLPEIPIRVRNAPRHLIVTPLPSTLSLTLEGGEQLLLGLKREDINATIDFQQVKGLLDHEDYVPIISVPEGVSYRNVKPATFKLMMERGNHASARN